MSAVTLVDERHLYDPHGQDKQAHARVSLLTGRDFLT